VRALIPFTLLLLVLLGMAWGARTLALALVVQSAEQGNIIPLSLSLARVPVPVGEPLHLSVPARLGGEPLWALGTLALTSGRVRLTRRGAVVVDIPLAQVAHLTVKGFTLSIDRRGSLSPVVLRVTQPAVIARYIQYLAKAAASRRSR